MKTILFTDLDDTLFSTARKQPINADFVLASTLKDGQASGYQSPMQQAFLQLWDNALIIPVTARNHEAFSRVKIPFSDVSVINHGGVILRADGTRDDEWHQQQLANAQESSAWLAQQQERLVAIADEMKIDVRLKINSDHDLALYVLLKSNQDDDDAVEAIARRYRQIHDDSKGYIHCNSNNLAILPNWLGKASAVEYLKTKIIAKYGECLFLGSGDSLSDLGFMQCCDFWIAPQGSQISTFLR